MNGKHPETSEITKTAIGNHVKAFSRQRRVTDKYIYALLAGDKVDPHSRYREWLTDVAAVNPDGACLMLADLADAIGSRPPTANGDLCSIKDIHREAADVIDAGLEGKPVAEQRKQIGELKAKLRAREILLDLQEECEIKTRLERQESRMTVTHLGGKPS